MHRKVLVENLHSAISNYSSFPEYVGGYSAKLTWYVRPYRRPKNEHMT